MDKYDNMLLKARAEMLGQQPLRKAPPHDALFSHVWNNLIKFDQQAFMEQQLSNQKQKEAQQRQQQTQERTQPSPPPADPFGQMNEGASLDGPTQGMGANFRQGRSETRDPNKTGMFGRAKQGIGNFMNRFKRQPSQQTESTPPSLQEETQETRAFRDMPRAEYPPSFRMATSDQRGEDGFPTRQSVVRNARSGSNDLAEWDRMNAIREQREAEPQQTQQAEQGNDFRAATRDKIQGYNDRQDAYWRASTKTPSPMQEAQEMKTPVDAGMDAMREPVDDDFYDRMTEKVEPRFDKPTRREFSDSFGQMNGLEEREELPPDFNTEIEPTTHWRDNHLTPETTDEEERQIWDATNEDEYLEERQMDEYLANPPLSREEQYPESPTDLDVLDREAEETPETEGAGISEWLQANPGNELESIDLEDTDALRDWVERNPEAVEQMGYSRERQEGKPTTQSGTKIPRKALPAPKVAPEKRQLPESVGDTETGEMAGIAGRKGFQEVNKRPDAVRFGTQAPDARDESGRLKEKKRRDKALAARSVDPTEATEKVLNPPKPKKAAPKKAKESPAAKAVKATASKRKAKAKPLEGTEEMREEAPKKGAAKVEATTSKAKPKKGASKVKATTSKAKPKKGASKVEETTSEAKPKKGSALASVNAVAEQRKAGANTNKPFANKAKPARKRTKNPKKTAIEGLGKAAARSRTRQAAKAKKNEPSEESAPEKEYGLSISGSASPDDISEIMEAARNGNKSAQSAIYNNAGTLEDSHGLSADEIQEASGR